MREGTTAPEAPSFDLGVQRISVHFSNRDVEAAAHRAVRLAEVAGLPPVTRDEQDFPMEIATPLMKSAAEQLAASNPELAIRLVLRTCSSETDKTLDRVVSRVQIAVLPALLDVGARLDLHRRYPTDVAKAWLHRSR